MKVSYFALLREATKKRSEIRERPAATVRDLLNDLVAEYGPNFARWIMKDGELAGFAIVLVNGQDVRGLQGLDTPLTPDSDVFIFPPLAGG
ncbi:ubiquitin-like small modifier protein 1 [Azospirillum lipoferum]|uniref:Molybdopterin converting factor n=1 Tax=Azospirillum lipoferum (strain 4B) TaxID=862719 RepID=G7ZCV2_AZOL4|nr:ubiquitin-like small modifier protein 1 [Azospirillum lipoferum]CBS89658.1 putative Molybdopterin converting factor [Azospirillum lipoferum 4B]